MIVALLLICFLGGCETSGPNGPIPFAPPFGLPEPPCEVPLLPDPDGFCLPLEDALIGTDGRLYWVDQKHPAAHDSNPGTREAPFLTIWQATQHVKPGDAVVVREGTYRENVRPITNGFGPNQRVTYAAYPGESVIISGARPMSGPWVRSGMDWRHVWTEDMRAYGEEPVMRREMVIADGEVLRAVYQRDDLEQGTFYVEGPDYAPSYIYVRLSGDVHPESTDMEAALEPHPFSPSGECGNDSQPEWLRIIGFTIRHASNRAQWGALCAGSRHGMVEDVTVEWTNGRGIDSTGENHIFRRNRTLWNGQMGFGGSCNNCLFDHNEIAHNNWKGHPPLWEAGGGKWVYSTGSTWTHNVVHHNGGPGIWLDIENHDNVIQDNYVYGNHGAGIFLEYKTTGTLVRNNLVAATRTLAWTGTGILSQAASHNTITHNTVVGNEGGGVWIRLDPNRRAPEGHNLITHNVIAGNLLNTEEAREMSIEDETLEDVQTSTFSSNVYGYVRADLMRSTFYVYPEPGTVANFRSSDIARWTELTGAENDQVLPISEILTITPDGRIELLVDYVGMQHTVPDVTK